METPEALDRMVANLVRRGVPRKYARRAAAEIDDHHRDLVDELRTAGKDYATAAAEASRRLGDRRMLVNKTIREFQRRYWCGRWRLLTFVLGPLPLLLLTWITTWAAAFCIVWPLAQLGLEIGKTGGPDGTISSGEHVFVFAIRALYLFILPALVVLFLAWLGRRAAMSRGWIIASACILAVCTGMMRWGFPESELNHVMLDGKAIAADQVLFTVGLFVPKSSAAAWWWHSGQFGQVLVPIAIAVVALLHWRQLKLQAERFVIDGS